MGKRSTAERDATEEDDDASPATAIVRESGTWAKSRRPPDHVGAPPEVVAGRDGPGPSMEEIYARHRGLVWKKLRKDDVAPESAEGLHQESFEELHRKMRAKGPPLSLAAALAGIAGNLLSNYRRVRRRRARFEVRIDATEQPSCEPGAEEQLLAAEAKQIVALALAKMPEDARMLIQWHDLEGQTHDQVATMLGLNVNTVKSRHHQAREAFLTLAKGYYKPNRR